MPIKTKRLTQRHYHRPAFTIPAIESGQNNITEQGLQRQLPALGSDDCNSINDNGYSELKMDRTQKWTNCVQNGCVNECIKESNTDMQPADIIKIWSRLPVEIRKVIASIITPYAKEEA
jgi:hypothetical protein